MYLVVVVKVLTSIVMATLVNKQLLDYTDPVVKHWPEYSKGDQTKQQTTIADVLRHEGGMAMFSKTMSLADIQTDNIKKNAIGSIIEDEPLRYPEHIHATRREYHTFTRGMILNEIFRRVDPQHRTVGEYLRTDVSGPLNIRTYIGLEHGELSSSFGHVMLPLPAIALQSSLPKTMRRVDPTLGELLSLGLHLLPYRNAVPVFEPLTRMNDVEDVIEKFSYSVVKTGEVPSANGQSTARGLAKIAAMVVGGGQVKTTLYTLLKKLTYDWLSPPSS